MKSMPNMEKWINLNLFSFQDYDIKLTFIFFFNSVNLFEMVVDINSTQNGLYNNIIAHLLYSKIPKLNQRRNDYEVGSSTHHRLDIMPNSNS